MPANPKLVLSNLHIHITGGDVEKCCDYRITEEVEGITTGDVGYVAADNLTSADVLEALKTLVVNDINSRQTTYTFALDDVVTWECSL